MKNSRKINLNSLKISETKNPTQQPLTMIKTFKCKETEKIWNGNFSRKFPTEIQRAVRRKLRLLHQSISLEDLKSPPGNHLEALSGNRLGQYSIRINQKYRICFRFMHEDCYHVELVDYH